MTSTQVPATTLDGFLSQLAPVSLTDLNDGASLLTRTDRKYVIPAVDAATVVAASTGRGARVLEIDGRREFGYESTYFDTPDLANYTAAAYGRRRRFKLRTRVYADSGECYFEVKTKGARGDNVKQRIIHEIDARSALTSNARAFAESCLIGAGLTAGLGAGRNADMASVWSPVLDTTYCRSTLVIGEPRRPGESGPDVLTRMTIDRDLRWHSPTGEHAHADKVVVIETKSASRTPSSLDFNLWQLGHRPARMSKYCTGLAVLDPQLPANRWHQVTTKALQLADH